MNFDTLELITITFWVILAGFFALAVTSIICSARVKMNEKNEEEQTKRARSGPFSNAGGSKD